MRFTNRKNNQERVENLLPTDQELCERRNNWSNLLEKFDKHKETDPAEIDVDSYIGMNGVDKESDESSYETIEPSEFEDNTNEDDNNFNINDVLNETKIAIAKRKESWHRTGIDQLMDTFSCDNIIDKVNNWLKTNTSGDISSVDKFNSPNRNFGTITINEKNIVMENASDNSADSVDTAKYILSNRKRRKQRVTMTIKEFRYSTRLSQPLSTNQNDFNRCTRKALENEKQSIKSIDYIVKASPVNKQSTDSSQESFVEEKTHSRPNKADKKDNTQIPHETISPKQRVHLKSAKKRDKRRSRSKTKSCSSASSSPIPISSNKERQSKTQSSSSSSLSSPTRTNRQFDKVNGKQSIKSPDYKVKASPVNKQTPSIISLSSDSSQASFVEEKAHSRPNKADKKDNTQIPHETISSEERVHFKLAKKRDKRRSRSKTKSPSSASLSPIQISSNKKRQSKIRYSSSSSWSSPKPTKRKYKVRAKTKILSNSKPNANVRCKIETNPRSSKQEAIIKSPITSRLATNVSFDLNSSKTNIVNSTALRSQQSMLHCKESFISGCEKAAADSTKTSLRSYKTPIVIYSPSKIQTPPNRRLTINEEYLVRTIGSELKDKFLSNRNNFEIECSARSKLIFVPPDVSDAESDNMRVTDSETDSLADTLERKRVSNGRIIEVVNL